MSTSGVILLVDNDVRLNKENRRALEFRRFTVHTVGSYEEADNLLFDLRPDIIMMEAVLPDGDGFAFCEKIYGTTSASIIFLTVKSDTDDMVRGFKSGGNEYITKPVYRDLMVARVENIMRRRHREAEQYRETVPLLKQGDG